MNRYQAATLVLWITCALGAAWLAVLAWLLVRPHPTWDAYVTQHFWLLMLAMTIIYTCVSAGLHKLEKRVDRWIDKHQQ